MNVNGKHYRTIWVNPNDSKQVCIIDQTRLPFEFIVKKIDNYKDMVSAIKDMEVRGAGLIGAAGAYAVYLALCKAEKEADSAAFYHNALQEIKKARPTAINLEWAANRMDKAVAAVNSFSEKCAIALTEAILIADEDAMYGKKIGEAGLPLIEEISHRKKGDVVNILTHCNAGWLALVDYGTALSPIYAAHNKGVKVHVWVDETRPRNQGALLSAWELAMEGVPHTVIADNAGGFLMQKGMVDMVIVGSDRTTYTGDVCNKIGTYLKALAAHDNNIPFYVAVYSSSFDWKTKDGVTDIPIELRSAKEMRFVKGTDASNNLQEVCIIPPDSQVSNYAFDITPAKYITALITERGICKANEESVKKLFAEKFNL